MRSRTGPLLAELHAHTTWSDGELSLPELVDLYGARGFDVLCVTDHVVRIDDPWLDPVVWSVKGVRADNWDAYLAQIEREAARALRDFGLVLPGLELTYNDLDPTEAAHAVAVGLHRFVAVDDGLDEAIESAALAGAALIAAHPYDAEPSPTPSRLTQRFARDRAGLSSCVHRFELFNRTQLFGWVAEAGLPSVASGDFHEPSHVGGWKTMLPCERDERAIVEYLRTSRPVYLVRLEETRRESLAAA